MKKMSTDELLQHLLVEVTAQRLVTRASQLAKARAAALLDNLGVLAAPLRSRKATRAA